MNRLKKEQEKWRYKEITYNLNFDFVFELQTCFYPIYPSPIQERNKKS